MGLLATAVSQVARLRATGVDQKETADGRAKDAVIRLASLYV